MRLSPNAFLRPLAAIAGFAALSLSAGPTLAADPIVQYMTKPDLKKAIENTKKEMVTAAKDMDFLLAAKLRDEMFALEKLMEERF